MAKDRMENRSGRWKTLVFYSVLPGKIQLNPSKTVQALFELPEEYDSMLEKGIGITGNDKHFFIAGRLEWVKQEFLEKPEPVRILDFGCGIGDSAIQLATLFPNSKIWAWDLSEPAIDYAKKCFSTSEVNFLTSEELEKSPGFDLVYINCVLHHVDPKDRIRVFQLIFSLVNPGGWVSCFENNPANPGTQLAMYTNPFDKGVVKIWPGELQSGFENAGFKATKRRFLFYFPQWLAWFRPLEKALTRLPLGGQYVVLAQKPFALR
jgi:SAM-dependent methyltransferase